MESPVKAVSKQVMSARPSEHRIMSKDKELRKGDKELRKVTTFTSR